MFFCILWNCSGKQRPPRILPQHSGSPRPSLVHIYHATMLPRVGVCCPVRATFTVWRGTASTSWVCCHDPVTAMCQHACPCRRPAWQSDVQTIRDHYHSHWVRGVTVATAEQLWAPNAWTTSRPGWCWPTSEPGLSPTSDTVVNKDRCKGLWNTNKKQLVRITEPTFEKLCASDKCVFLNCTPDPICPLIFFTCLRNHLKQYIYYPNRVYIV